MWQFLLLWTVSVIPLSGRSIWHGLFLFSIFLHFPIDFLFADFAGCSADNLDPKTFPHELSVHVGIMPAEPIVLGWRENSLVVQNGADAP